MMRESAERRMMRMMRMMRKPRIMRAGRRRRMMGIRGGTLWGGRRRHRALIRPGPGLRAAGWANDA